METNLPTPITARVYVNLPEGIWLVVTGTMEFYDFPYLGNVIIPTDEVIFFKGVGIPPTRYDIVEFQDSEILRYL
jgi:hypothetical protein